MKFIFYVIVFFNSSAYCAIHHYKIIDQTKKADDSAQNKDNDKKIANLTVGSIAYDDKTNLVSMRSLFTGGNVFEIDVHQINNDGLFIAIWRNARRALILNTHICIPHDRENMIFFAGSNDHIADNSSLYFSLSRIIQTSQENKNSGRVTHKIFHELTTEVLYEQSGGHLGHITIPSLTRLSHILAGRFTLVPTCACKDNLYPAELMITEEQFTILLEGLSILARKGYLPYIKIFYAPAR